MADATPEPSHVLRLVEDILEPGAAAAWPALNRVVYVRAGDAGLNDARRAADEAWFGAGPCRARAGRAGATLWRWELVPPGVAADAGPGSGVLSALKLASPLATIDRSVPWLMRCDSVAFPPGGCAYLHTHQGPGIRCLAEGGIRIDTAGHATHYAPGGAWFEAGPDPVFAQAADEPTRFVRVMILPRDLLGRSSIAYVREEDQAKPKSQSYKGYVDVAIER